MNDLKSDEILGRDAPSVTLKLELIERHTKDTSRWTSPTLKRDLIQSKNIQVSDKLISECEDLSITQSPRSRFIEGCMKLQMPPRALMIIRQQFTTALNLAHIGKDPSLTNISSYIVLKAVTDSR